MVDSSLGANFELIDQDGDGRVILIKGEVSDQSVALCNLYAPNTDEPKFYKQVVNLMEQIEDVDVIVMGGDFNLVLDPKIDRLDSLYNHHGSATILKEYMENVNLQDIWRLRNPDSKRFTWFRDGIVCNRISASRIDMLLISGSFCDRVTSCEISPSIRTDHSLVTVGINLDMYTRGPGAWKLNTRLLQDDIYKEIIKNSIATVMRDCSYLNPSDKWEEIKIKCAQMSRSYSRIKAKKLHNEFDHLLELKAFLVEDKLRNPLETSISNSLRQIELRIESVDRINTEASIFRSRCKWYEFGERNMKFFFGLEKRNYSNKNMKMIITEAGQHVWDQKGILEEQTKFYKSLYTKNPDVRFNLLPGPLDKQLSMEDRIYCEQEITIDELFDGVMTLKSNKCPGGDGLPNEFYRVFFKELSLPLLQMAKHSYELRKFPKSTRRGIISLLPKKNKDSRFVKNMRPLTLLNSDNKIIAKVLHNHLRTFLPEIIHCNQTGFLRKRNITSNIHKSLDLIEFTKSSNIPAVILMVDMQKCFDMVDYTAIEGALNYFNFGPIFTNWVMLFYTDIQVCTQNMGLFSNFFTKTRSTNQGCIISPAVFLLISEILAIKLRGNSDIRGIRVKEVEYLISQFADDMDLYLPFDSVVLNAVCDELSDIESHTGLRVSYDKTMIYRIGSIANSNVKCYTKRKLNGPMSPLTR